MAVTKEDQLKADIEAWSLVVKYSTSERLAEEVEEEGRRAENKKLDAAIRRCQLEEKGKLI